MQYTTLGRTGLEVSVAGLGAGGFSRLGQSRGASEAESVDLVRAALDAGVNLVDTAAAYGTERIVGKAIAGRPRDAVVISTKAQIRRGGEPRTAAEVVADLDRSLRELGVDHVDVYHLHGVRPAEYDRVVGDLVPALLAERERGKLRFLGITETAPNDPTHEMLARAVPSGLFDVVMVAFHMLHQSARARVFPLTLAHDVGTLVMFAVRNVFSQPQRLREEIERVVAQGHLPRRLLDDPDPLGFLVHEAGARSLVDAAYRFCRHEPGADVVLFGTGSRAHLEENLRSLLAPPLPASDVARLRDLFGHLTDVGLDAPA